MIAESIEILTETMDLQESCKLNIAVVLYNTCAKDAASLDVFLEAVAGGSARLYFLDNSTDAKIKAENSKTAQSLGEGVTYLDNGGNIGLSKSYNRLIGLVEDRSSWIMLSDDDTSFSKEYMDNVTSEIRRGAEADVLCGIIKSGAGYFSPKKSLGLLSKEQEFIEKPGLYKDIFAVNSGLVIKRSVFDTTGRYREELFLDMVDHYFMHRLSECGINTIKVLGGEVTQSFSAEVSSYKDSMKRFRLFRKDYAAYCRLCGLGIRYRWLVPAKRYAGILLRAMHR